MYNQKQHLHFVGIGGVGMAGIAEVLVNLGYQLSGSDMKESHLTAHLAKLGVSVAIGHSADNVPQQSTIVVKSSAIDEENIEIKEARRRGILIIPRAEMLSELMRMQYGIAIAGSHGKTTTTSIVGHLLQRVGMDPTVIVGGRLQNQLSGASVGKGKYFVAESDESDGSFCLLRPAIGVVTNIDSEHLSHYGSFAELERSFFQFMSSVPFYGAVIACIDDPIVAKLIAQLRRRVITYGLSPGSDISALNVEVSNGASSFELMLKGESYGKVRLPLPGTHMVSNSLASLGVALELGAEVDSSIAALEQFPGVARRSEVLGDTAGVRVIDDYGHHPSEIRNTLPAIRDAHVGDGGRMVVLFQPHRYSRTRDLFTDFLSCFDSADQVILDDIYPAGEEAISGVDSESLSRAVKHKNVTYQGKLSDSVEKIASGLEKGDVVVTLGAGDIGKLGPRLLKQLGGN